MNNSRTRKKSIALNGSPQARIYRTFEDWQAEQQADLRTPAQRGIHVGSPVMWRHRANQVIITEQAIVAAIDDQTLTLHVKDVKMRTCSARVSEIVDHQFGLHSLAQASRRAPIANQMEAPKESSAGAAAKDALNAGSRL